MNFGSWRKEMGSEKRQSPSKSQAPSSFISKYIVKNEEEDQKFSIQKFRSTLHDKAQQQSTGKFLQSSNEFEKKQIESNFFSMNNSSSTRNLQAHTRAPSKETNLQIFVQSSRNQNNNSRFESAPTFDALEKSIRGYSSTRTKEDTNFSKVKTAIVKSENNYSPKKFSGLKQKISNLGATKLDSSFKLNLRNESPLKHQQMTGLLIDFKLNKPQSIGYSSSGFTEDFFQKQTRALTHVSTLNSFTPKPRNIADVIPLNQLIELRNKIEQAENSQVVQLTPNYVNELVKLAQVITTSVKRIR